MSRVNPSGLVASSTQADPVSSPMEPPECSVSFSALLWLWLLLFQTVEPPPPLVQPNEVNNDEGNSKKKRKVGEASTSPATNDAHIEAGDTGNRKPIKPRSWTWKHFTKKGSRANCNWCGASYAADSHKNGTSNLQHHLLHQCLKFPKESLDPTQQTLVLQQLKKEDGNESGSVLTGVHFDAEACRKALARMIVVDELPFKILNFCPIVDHKGFTIGKKIEKCLEEWLIGKVFTVTVDNASSNDVAITYLKNTISDWNSHPLKGEYMHVRCCAHILNLVVQDGLKDYHSSIRKIRNAVNNVRKSSGRLERFKTCIKEARIQEKSIVKLDVSTRWNSTYIMLESALKFQKAFKKLSEKCADFVLMQDGCPNNVDWDNARCFVNFLKIFFDITNKVSGSTFVTSSQYFNEHVMILTTFKGWIELKSSDNLLGKMAEDMKAKYEKYWGDVKKMNMLIFVAVALDPRHKMSYKIFVGQGKTENPTHSSQSNEVELVELKAPEDAFAAEVEMDMDLNDNMQKNEVDLYLMENLEKKSPGFDLLNWWKVNSTKYPILAQMARDILVIPLSTIASESAFSTGVSEADIEELLDELEQLELELAPIPQLNEDVSDYDSD
ncbi:hypothetical protein TSUD_386230 [Trifolium subterraneum]|uniref:BED-type domain-containing protein n=1 Tax=Trifolium subterraneum TaxID=3900 RepID=A0A2Z6LVI3_TRISU|nr:hypothetical protein TSUD_386230 [Trifolium subterraneum]